MSFKPIDYNKDIELLDFLGPEYEDYREDDDRQFLEQWMFDSVYT